MPASTTFSLLTLVHFICTRFPLHFTIWFQSPFIILQLRCDKRGIVFAMATTWRVLHLLQVKKKAMQKGKWNCKCKHLEITTPTDNRHKTHHNGKASLICLFFKSPKKLNAWALVPKFQFDKMAKTNPF